MIRLLLKAYYVVAYYLSFFVFGAGGLWLSVFCLCLAWLPSRPSVERFFQKLLRGHFVVWQRWLSLLGLQSVRYVGFHALPRERGLVLVANHIGLTDITYLLAHLPAAFCIFKPTIRRNPVLGATARSAGYLASDGGHDMLRAAAEKVSDGQTLIVFPEGTRSVDGALGPLKPGFVVIARRAHAPIQLVRIACDTPLLLKGRAWWKVPPLPARVTVTLGPCLLAPEQEETDVIVSKVEAWYRHESSTRPLAPSPVRVVAPSRPATWQPVA